MQLTRVGAIQPHSLLARASGLLLILITAILAGCSNQTTRPKTEDKIALFGYLYVGDSLHDGILLNRTKPIDEYYNAHDALITNALVTLWREGADRIDTLHLDQNNRYANPSVIIDSLATYHLKAVVPGGPTLEATTTTPRPFRAVHRPQLQTEGPMVHSAIADSFPIVVRCADPEQIFLVDVFCLENWQDARYVYNIGPDEHPRSYEEYGSDNGEPRHIFAYFRAKNLKRTDEGYLISFYGDMMAFYGKYDVGVYAIDTNIYNYLYRDHPELNGGVTGGIGVFGSASRRTYAVETIE